MDKKTFVETLLNDAIATAAGYVARLEFSEESEIVDIVCNNGYRYHVNVACDSNLGIMQDVLSEVCRH